MSVILISGTIGAGKSSLTDTKTSTDLNFASGRNTASAGFTSTTTPAVIKETAADISTLTTITLFTLPDALNSPQRDSWRHMKSEILILNY